jgi:hypothetical protein
MSIWNELGIEPTTDGREIKRAYAARLKEVHPEDDAAGFQRLRRAYEDALAHSDARPRSVAPVARKPREDDPQLPNPRVPFRAHPAAHRRNKRVALSPIIVTRGADSEAPKQPPRGRDAVVRLQNVYADQTEQAAVELLHQLCAASAQWSVDDREQFERDLAKWLGSFDPVRWPLLIAADQHFEWSRKVDDALGRLIDPAVRRVAGSLNRRAVLERFRGDLLRDHWPEKRRRMIDLLFLPFAPEALDARRAKLSRWARETWFEEFRTLAEKLEGEYGSLDDLGVDARTVEYWTRQPKRTKSKGLLRGSLVAAAAMTVVFELALAVLRAFDVAPEGIYSWWAESLWVFAVITTAFQMWLNDRLRTVSGLACASLSWPSFVLIPSFAPFTILLSFLAMWAAVGFSRTTIYMLMGSATSYEINPIVFAWLGEALRWLLGLRRASEPSAEFGRFARPALVYVVLLLVFVGAVYPERRWWTRVLFAAGWIAAAESLAWYVRKKVHRR